MGLTVQLRIQSLPICYRVEEAPLTGKNAKSMGQAHLEKKTGLQVQFSSYQISEGKPELSLGDEERVNRGSILNYTVALDSFVSQQLENRMLLQGLYEDKLRAIISKFSARFCSAAVHDAGIKEAGGCSLAFSASTSLAAAASQVLQEAGSQLSATDFAGCLDALYTHRNRTCFFSHSSLQQK